MKWIEKHKDNIFAFADLDLQYLPNVGYEKVYEWRKKYFEPFMLRTGVPCCFIYHDDGLDYWDYMCKRYPYVGMSMAVDSSKGDAEIREMFSIAEKHGGGGHARAAGYTAHESLSTVVADVVREACEELDEAER